MLRWTAEQEDHDTGFGFAEGLRNGRTISHGGVRAAAYQLRKAKSKCTEAADTKPFATRQAVT